MIGKSHARLCHECATRLPKGQLSKFCSSDCLNQHMDKFWGQPRKKPKRWYGPVPEVAHKRKYKKKDELVLEAIEADVIELEKLISADGIDLEKV